MMKFLRKEQLNLIILKFLKTLKRKNALKQQLVENLHLKREIQKEIKINFHHLKLNQKV